MGLRRMPSRSIRPQLGEFAITVIDNFPSWGLMERLGMRRNLALDFDHPDYAPGDPLRPHIVYEIARREPTESGR
jgi:RimJ/RimL family protein N-acetyltransferase